MNLLAISGASFGLLLNLGLLAVATFYVKQAGGNQAAVTYISTGIAFTTFNANVLYHIYIQTNISQFRMVLCCRKDDRDNNNYCDGPVDSGDKPVAAPSTTYVSYAKLSVLRFTTLVGNTVTLNVAANRDQKHQA